MCPVCQSSDCSNRFKLYDDRYGYPGEFNLLRCNNCGHGFLDCLLSSDEIQALYTDYYPRSSFDVEDYVAHEEVGGFQAYFNGLKGSAFRWVPKDVRVLDIGCGFGETLGYHQARGCEVFGVEADENIRRVAEKYDFDVHVGLFDPELYESASFDYVTMDQVMEHVTDPLVVMNGLAKVIKPDGRIILSFPNANGWGGKLFGKRWIHWHAPYHLQFYSRNSLDIMVAEAGLMIESMQTTTNSDWLHYQWLHFLLFPRAGVPSQFWIKSSDRTFLSKVICKGFAAFHLLKINHLITRLFDVMGVGDNIVVVLKKAK